MNRKLLAFFLVAGCPAPEGPADSASPAEGVTDLVIAARRVMASCVSRSFEDGDLLYTTTYDAFGWEVESDDGDGPYGSSTTYVRQGDEVVSSVTEHEDGDRLEEGYDAHEHVEDKVDSYNDGTQVDAIAMDLEHDGERLLASGYTFLGTVFRETVDDCENVALSVHDDEVLVEGEWEYAADCLPSRSVLDFPTLGFVQTATYEAGLPVGYSFTGSLETVNEVEWDCP